MGTFVFCLRIVKTYLFCLEIISYILLFHKEKMRGKQGKRM